MMGASLERGKNRQCLQPRPSVQLVFYGAVTIVMHQLIGSAALRGAMGEREEAKAECNAIIGPWMDGLARLLARSLGLRRPKQKVDGDEGDRDDDDDGLST